jgi:hypothetical protein
MSKSTVTRLFFAAIAALAVGLVMSLATVIAALAGGVVHIGGPNVVHVDGAALVGALPWLLLAVLVFTAGEVAALAAWIGALLNTWQLDDKTWFVALLVLGLFSFGWIAMAAYVLAGPDARRQDTAHAAIATASGP